MQDLAPVLLRLTHRPLFEALCAVGRVFSVALIPESQEPPPPPPPPHPTCNGVRISPVTSIELALTLNRVPPLYLRRLPDRPPGRSSFFFQLTNRPTLWRRHALGSANLPSQGGLTLRGGLFPRRAWFFSLRSVSHALKVIGWFVPPLVLRPLFPLGP